MTETLRLQMLQFGLLPVALLLAMLLMAEIGWRIGREVVSRRKTPAPETAISDSDNALIGSVFGLLALLIAFTFSGASCCTQCETPGRRRMVRSRTY